MDDADARAHPVRDLALSRPAGPPAARHRAVVPDVVLARSPTSSCCAITGPCGSDGWALILSVLPCLLIYRGASLCSIGTTRGGSAPSAASVLRQRWDSRRLGGAAGRRRLDRCRRRAAPAPARPSDRHCADRRCTSCVRDWPWRAVITSIAMVCCRRRLAARATLRAARATATRPRFCGSPLTIVLCAPMPLAAYLDHRLLLRNAMPAKPATSRRTRLAADHADPV